MKKKISNHDLTFHIGKRLRMRRTMLGLSQEQVGRGIGIASQQVQKYEKGTNVVNAIRLYEFSQFFKVPVAYFYEGLEKSTATDKSKTPDGFEEEGSEYDTGPKATSDRETLEVTKSFKRIKDKTLRKRVADLVHWLSKDN